MITNKEYILSVDGLKKFEKDIPNFKFPQSYLKVVDLGMLDFEYWFLLSNDLVRTRFNDMQARYKNRKLIPFAGRYDSDDTACFEIDHGEQVFIVHDFSGKGYERRQEFNTFGDWFICAIKELIGIG